MRISGGKVTRKAASSGRERQERSAALPSGEGEAALLGVLASGLGSALRYCYWRAPFRAALLRALASNLRANLFASQSFVHPVFRFPAKPGLFSFSRRTS